MLEPKIAYSLTFRDLIRVLRLIDETPFCELSLELGELKLHVVQDAKERPNPAPNPEPAAPPQAAKPQPVALSAAEVDGTPVLAPLAGTFYRSPYPGEPPFVEVGKSVKQGDVIGILEIMKLMNHVSAPCAGVVSRICAQNEEFVEYGRVLAVIEPAGR